MARANINVQNAVSVRLLELRRHLKICEQCRAAMKSRDTIRMCDWSLQSIVEIAIRWDRNIPGRLAARNGDERYIFPCPDTSAHGPAYALTAEACTVQAIQDRLI